ncbi:MAG: ribosome biogenesis GTP-binding protein YihA/YsxC [Bacilli bacterium]
MIIKTVNLTISAVRSSQYPSEYIPEFLLLGRSNVGKSSFINTIINRKNYAHTSSKPGKTRTLNFYNVNEQFNFVDVPGYGYASVSKSQREKFGKMIEEYLETRKQLKKIFLIVDVRHKPSKDDLLMYNFLKHYNLPIVLILTKVDKIGKTVKHKYERIILESFDLAYEDKYILFSSVTKEGKEKVHEIIEEELKK